MSRTVQIRRGTTAQHATFTGAQGELTYNTTTKRLHTQDGATLTGNPHALLSEVVSGDAASIAAATAAQAAAEATAAAALAARVATLAGTGGAGTVGALDAGGYFAGTTVEAQLQEIGADAATMPDVDFWSFFSTAQKADIKAYTFGIDCTVALQAAMDAAWAAHQDVRVPAGGYKIDAASLILPGTYPTLDERDQAFRIYGQGAGNPFTTTNGGGTIFKSTSDRPILTDRAVTVPNAQGTFEIDHIRFDGSSTTPVVLLNTFYGVSSLHNCVIYQRGVGDGLYIGYAATATVYESYFINKDFATAVIGAGRTGVGLNYPNGYGAGLFKVYSCSSRGWHDGYVIGATGGVNNNAFSSVIRDFECSTVYNGVTLTAKATNCVVHNGYFEGMDGGTGIADAGFFNQITKNMIFAGFAIGIDLQSGSGYGTICADNEIATSTRASTTCINVVGNSGLGRTVRDNIIVWGSSGGTIAGVSGITISGANPQLNMSGNMFSPKINWVGGAGSQQITDNSTSTLSAGSGLYGLGTASFSNLQVPMLNQGALSLALDGTTITTVTAGVAALTAASDFLITFAGATNLTGFTAPNLEGKLFFVRVTNQFCTFKAGASLKMAGGIDYTPGVNGATVLFKCHANVCWEMSRTAY